MSTTEGPSSTFQSLTSTASTTGASSSSSASGGSGDGGDRDSSSSLYLFTFLATLFLLLFVSSAIVMRSFILRRRFRRSMEEAIAAGIILPGPQTGYRKRNFGEKPVMWDVSISSSGYTWDGMKPISAKSLTEIAPLNSDRPPETDSNADSPRPHTTSMLNRTFRPFIRRTSSAATFPSPRSTPSPSLRAAAPGEPGSPKATAETSQVQVAVLVQMPCPHRSRAGTPTWKGKERSAGGEWEDEEFPDVVIGVAEEPCKGQLEQ